MADSSNGGVTRVKEAFAVPGVDGVPRVYTVGALIGADDPLVRTHKHLLEPVADAVEKASAAPGERRALRLPSGVRLKQATEPHTGSLNNPSGAHAMVHALPPEDENSPASPFAPEQPAAGVVADDVPDEQNKAGAPKAAEVTEKAAKAAAKK